MEALDYWRLCEELTVYQAAMLAVSADPCEKPDGVDVPYPPGFEAARNAISSALLTDSISGRRVPEYEPLPQWDDSLQEIPDSVHIHNSRVEVGSLRKWLERRGFKSGFFFPDPTSQDYLDSRHPRYAPKLAAAVRAWIAMEDKAATIGKSPKQALTKWLREHANEFGLTDDDGKPNETGIEEAAKVANWQLAGGAPKTPSGNPPSP